jgi:2-polyprenyl-3-methyl-5-hydroxy-6-metoxy-1,4-benzoquinol methylase
MDYAPHPESVLQELDASRNYNGWIFERARPHLGRRVLDAGAGLGAFSALAAAAGAEVLAVEPDRAFVATLRDRFADEPRIEVVEGTAEDPRVAGSFDSVLCLNVLEHVRDDAAVIAGFRDRLAPGGRLLLLVPAHPRLYAAYDRAVGHERRYEKDALRALLEQTGFEVDDIRHVNPVGALAWLLMMRPRRQGDWPSRSFRTFDRIVPLVRPLDRLRLPVGLSLWVVARRPVSGA